MLDVLIFCGLLFVIYGGKIFWGFVKWLFCDDISFYFYFFVEEFLEILYCYKDNFVCNFYE